MLSCIELFDLMLRWVFFFIPWGRLQLLAKSFVPPRTHDVVPRIISKFSYRVLCPSKRFLPDRFVGSCGSKIRTVIVGKICILKRRRIEKCPRVRVFVCCFKRCRTGVPDITYAAAALLLLASKLLLSCLGCGDGGSFYFLTFYRMLRYYYACAVVAFETDEFFVRWRAWSRAVYYNNRTAK